MKHTQDKPISSIKEKKNSLIFKYYFFFCCHVSIGYSPKHTGDIRKQLGCYSWPFHLCLAIVRNVFAFSVFMKKKRKKKKELILTHLAQTHDLFCLLSLWIETVSNHCCCFISGHWGSQVPWNSTRVWFFCKFFHGAIRAFFTLWQLSQLIPPGCQFPAFLLQAVGSASKRDPKLTPNGANQELCVFVVCFLFSLRGQRRPQDKGTDSATTVMFLESSPRTSFCIGRPLVFFPAKTKLEFWDICQLCRELKIAAEASVPTAILHVRYLLAILTST